MKTKMFSFALLCAVFVIFSGCKAKVWKDISETSEELNEVLSGKLFTVSQGTVVYNNYSSTGVTTEAQTIFTFRNNGKEWAVVDGTNIQIVKGDKFYTLDASDKTGSCITFGQEVYGACDYVFFEKGIRFDEVLYEEDNEVREGTEVIAGKNCVKFTWEDGAVEAGWNRVLFKDIDSDGWGIIATSWSDNVTNEIFSTEGYTITNQN